MRTYTEDQLISAIIRANKAGYHNNRVVGIYPPRTATDGDEVGLVIEPNAKSDASSKHWAD